MKWIYIFFSPVVIMAYSMNAAAVAGGMEGGGGEAVVCRDSRGKIKSAGLLDLWEARELYRRTLTPSKRTIKDQVEAAFAQLKYSVDGPLHAEEGPGDNGIKSFSSPEWILVQLRETAALFLKNSPVVLRLRGKELIATHDADLRVFPDGCKPEQVVDFQDGATPQILVNQDLVDRLPITDQAALVVHEAFYAYLRANYHEQTSVRTRRAVGFVFSKGTFDDPDALFGKQYVDCRDKDAGQWLQRGTIVKFVTSPSDGLNVIESIFRGEPNIGLFRALSSNEDLKFIGGSLDAIVGTNGLCKNTGDHVYQGLVTVGLAGKGPVDFQRDHALIFGCDHRKLTVGLYSDVRGLNPDENLIPLTCTMSGPVQ